MKNYIVSSREILNSDPNNRPYAKLQQERQTIQAIHKKYGILPYQNTTTEIYTYTREVYNIGIKLSEGVIQKLKECITKKGGRDPKVWNDADWVLREKICNKEGIYDKINIFRKDIETYDKQLNKYINNIATSSDMRIADQIADQIKQYHDSNFGLLIARKEEVLHDFEVEIMGMDYGN